MTRAGVSAGRTGAVTGARRGRGAAALALALSLALAGCVTPSGGGGAGTDTGTAGAGPGTTTPRPGAASGPDSGAGAPRIVALLLPLSGQGAEVGRRLQAAARDAVTPARARAIRLTVHDTAGTPEGARRAVAAVLAEDADLVLGPVFSSTTQAARAGLTPAGVPVLSFSNNSTIAGNGVYVLGDLPDQQTKALLSAAAGAGHGRVVVLAPDTAYARLADRAARALSGQGGVQVLSSRLFAPDTPYNDQVQIVRDLTRTDLTGAVLPTSGLSLAGLSALFDYYNAGLPRVRLLGTSLWEWPGTFRESSLQGGWYVSTSLPPRGSGTNSATANTPATSKAGTKAEAPAPAEAAAEATPAADPAAAPDQGVPAELSAAAGPVPTVVRKPDAPERPRAPAPEPLRLTLGPDKLERLALDAVALAAAWAGRANTNADFAGFVTDPDGFRGFSGLFRIKPDGGNERGLHVLEVTPDGPRLVRPAPDRFAYAGAPHMLIDAADRARHPWLARELGLTESPTAAPGPVSSAPRASGAAPSRDTRAPAPTPASADGCRWVRDCVDGDCRSRRACPPMS